MFEINKIYHGDCLDVMRGFPDESINCCVTSPPYFGLRDYQTATWDGGDTDCDHKAPPMHGSVKTSTLNLAKKREESSSFVATEPQYRDVCKKCGAKRIDAQLGLEKTPEEYVSNMVEVFREVKRVLRTDGTLWLNLGDSYASGKGTCYNPGGGESSLGKDRKEAMAHPLDRGNKSTLAASGLKPKDLVGIPWMVAFALRADGWYLRSDIIWHKPNPMPESVTDRPTKSHEYIFLLSKSQKYYYDAEAIKEDSVDNESYTGRRKRNAGQMDCIDSKNYKFHGSIKDGKLRSGQTYPKRNKRSVWTITTKPFKKAHFATFPTKLIEPCILAGCPAKCCPVCGAGWVRIVERNDINQKLNEVVKTTGVPGLKPGTSGDRVRKLSGSTYQYVTGKTLGFKPSCQCNATNHVPGIVLDPFMGAGTVGLVAVENNRNYIGCELNPEYIKIAEQRITQAQPQLF